MTDLAAAIGKIQLGRLPAWTETRIANAAVFNRGLARAITPKPVAGTTHVFHQYTIRVPAGAGRVPAGADRDGVVTKLNARGVGVRVYYPKAIHQQPVFERDPRYRELSLPETERATREVISLPVHPGLSEEERAYIVKEVNEAC
jgi:dTDP-4-amino-4,6-dideoxygalactose transaminase